MDPSAACSLVPSTGGEARACCTDPANEPPPPKIDDAGELGEVGARKLDERQKDAIWRDRPPTPDQDPEAEPRR